MGPATGTLLGSSTGKTPSERSPRVRRRSGKASIGSGGVDGSPGLDAASNRRRNSLRSAHTVRAVTRFLEHVYADYLSGVENGSSTPPVRRAG